MNYAAEELIKNSNVNALKIREKREAEEERKKRQAKRDQEQTERLIKKAEVNGQKFTKYLLFKILDEYEKTPEAIANFDNNCYIWDTIQFLGQFSTSYYSKNKKLCEIYNASLNNDLYQYIYYLEIINGDKKTYLPIRIDFEKLEGLGIFAEHLKMDYDRNLKIKVDMHKLRILTAKAKNGELTEGFLDKETIKRLQEAYDSVRAKENELINFLYSIKSNSDIAYLDIMKRLISAYKSKPNNKEITVDISLIASDPESPCERMVRLFKDSKIDIEDAVVYYPIKTNNNPRVKPILYPIRVSDVMAKIKEDLPDTYHYVSVHGRKECDFMYIKVNTQDFESLLISIQNPDEQTRKLHK